MRNSGIKNIISSQVIIPKLQNMFLNKQESPNTVPIYYLRLNKHYSQNTEDKVLKYLKLTFTLNLTSKINIFSIFVFQINE